MKASSSEKRKAKVGSTRNQNRRHNHRHGGGRGEGTVDVILWRQDNDHIYEVSVFSEESGLNVSAGLGDLNVTRLVFLER